MEDLNNPKLNNSEIISWKEAMNQVDDDEEFLLQLLNQFAVEIENKLSTIEEALEELNAESVPKISRSAHAIKGTASNLLCNELRQTAHELASVAIDYDDDDLLNEKYEALKEAFKLFRSFLQAINKD